MSSEVYHAQISAIYIAKVGQFSEIKCSLVGDCCRRTTVLAHFRLILSLIIASDLAKYSMIDMAISTLTLANMRYISKGNSDLFVYKVYMISLDTSGRIQTSGLWTAELISPTSKLVPLTVESVSLATTVTAI